MNDASDRLSERLREQVAALYEPEAGEGPPLGRDAQRRMVQQLVAEASRLERRRRQRVWLGSVAGSVLLAAAVLLAYLRAPEPQPESQLKAAKVVQPAAADCRLPLVTSAELSAPSLALGGLGELVSQPGTELSVESSSPCELALRLSSGTLAGDLHSLRPARLVIRTDHGEVIVTGTRFSVHSDAELEVLLETGVVDVQLQGAGKLRLQPRTRLHKGRRAALSSDDARRLDGWLKPAPPAPPPPAAAAPAPQTKPLFESSSAALTAAEAAWRAERWTSAREAYRFASQAKDSNAEIALLRWARFELQQAAPATALRLISEHKRRFARGVLGADARFIEVQAHKALGHGARAEQAARALISRYPDTPQAAAARKLIEE